MAARKKLDVRPIAACVVSCLMAVARAQDSTQVAPAALERVPLDVVATVPVTALPAQSMALPILCSPENMIVVRPATGDGIQDPVAVSDDGQVTTRYGRDKITDIPHPIPLNVFLGDSSVYMLVLGHTPLGRETQWRTPTGEVKREQASTNSPFVARFRANGTYVGAVSLSVPFRPLQLGVFPSGDFLVAGADKQSDEPRLAIVSSTGQFLRFVELPGDVTPRKGLTPQENGKSKGQTVLPHFAPGEGFGKSLIDVVYGSQIVADGPNLLLFRPSNGPIFVISPGGDAQTRRLKLKGTYMLETVKTNAHSWIAELTRDLLDGKGEQFVTYAFDRDTGTPLTEYVYPQDLGFGMACTDGNKFTFVEADMQTETLKLVKLAISSQPSSN